MALKLKMMINEQEIGNLVAVRQIPLGITPSDDTICVYAWAIVTNGREKNSNEWGLMQHRYGDGPWALAVKIAQRVGYAR